MCKILHFRNVTPKSLGGLKRTLFIFFVLGSSTTCIQISLFVIFILKAWKFLT